MPRWSGAVAVGAVVIGAVAEAVGAASAPAQPAPEACDRFVSPTGDDEASGSPTEPWRSLEHAALGVPDLGCTVWFAPGTYRGSNQVKRAFTRPTTFRSTVPYRARFTADENVIDIDGAARVVIEGFDLSHAGPGSDENVVNVDEGDGRWAEDIIIRDNIIHGSFDDDLLKIHNGARRVTVEGNLLFDRGPSSQHLDVNGVTDVVVQDNVFFDRPARAAGDRSQHFIIIKDSNEDAEGLLGAHRITVRRNVLLNWRGGRDMMVKVGNDGKPFHEADTVRLENNLFVGNSQVPTLAPFGVAGVRQVSFANNTIVGDLPSERFGFHLEIKGDNPRNEDVTVADNIWSDPTGTMDRFATATADDTSGLDFSTNLYWNADHDLPEGRPTGPDDDDEAVVGDPRLAPYDPYPVLPIPGRYGFRSGSRTIRQEFLRLVAAFAAVDADGAGVDRADPDHAATDDILGRRRDRRPDLGAFEVTADRRGLRRGQDTNQTTGTS